MGDEPLTVGELIELLQDVEDKDLPIYSDGCDCVELAFFIDLYEDGIIVHRQRSKPNFVPGPPLPTLEELTDQAMRGEF